MPLRPPNLDDRSFAQLLESAVSRAKQTCPEWTDYSAGDPGVVLLELFSFLTETMLFQLNRLPDKAYVEFLRLLGVQLLPPSAARVTLRFARSPASGGELRVPPGTRVAGKGGGNGPPPVFTTLQEALLPAGTDTADVPALHADQIEAELLGVSSGLPGQTFRLARPGVIAPTEDGQDLLVGVRARPEELNAGLEVLPYRGDAYLLWREVPNFAGVTPEARVYLADHSDGTLTFAPAVRLTAALGADSASGANPGITLGPPQALAAVPPPGMEVRAWYRSGGGPAGNVAAGTLTVPQGPLPGLSVSNPDPASGGQAAETLENALRRGPLEARYQGRAVTAQDYEAVALNTARSVGRARAFTRRTLWAHGTPGTVELALVPYLPPEAREGLSVLGLRAAQQPGALEAVAAAVAQRRTLGTDCAVGWAGAKAVRVRATVHARRYQNLDALRARLISRLNLSVAPLPTLYSAEGWRFGQPLYASNVFEMLLAEPGVGWVDGLSLHVDAQPDRELGALAADAFQPGTWYAGSGSRLFRSLNDGAGWELLQDCAPDRIVQVCAHPEVPGRVAVVTEPADGGGRVQTSGDCGESWTAPTSLAFSVQQAAWISRPAGPALLLATDRGLLELGAGTQPEQVAVVPDVPAQPLYAVAAHRSPGGDLSVAVAAQGQGGVWLSAEGGRGKTFRLTGLKGSDVRVMAVQRDGPRSFLWAGLAATGDQDGPGCRRWELRGREDPPEGWVTLSSGWKGGSCFALAFTPDAAVAATHHAGVVRLALQPAGAAWVTPGVDSGLPLTDGGRFLPVGALAAREGLVLAGTAEQRAPGQAEEAPPPGRALLLSRDAGASFAPGLPGGGEGAQVVTLPPTWLFCSGGHDLSVVGEDHA